MKNFSIMIGKKSEILPPPAEVRAFVDKATVMLFPLIKGGRCKRKIHSRPESNCLSSISKKRVERKLSCILRPLENRLPVSPIAAASYFAGKLPDVQKKAQVDAEFIADGDPASEGVNEVIMAYPGFFAILVHRMANILHNSGVPLVPRIMTEYAHSLTGIDIHPGASLGNPFFIDHGTGIVIGETSEIGDRVKIYQGVTIGALSVSRSATKGKRHPTIEDDVIIYAGSTILGGDTVIGRHSIIGGNVWLTRSIPPYSMVYNESKVNIRERKTPHNK